MVEIAYFEAHVVLDVARRERRLTFWLTLATWVLAGITAVLASAAIWGWGTSG
jgi:hypothetical protein